MRVPLHFNIFKALSGGCRWDKGCTIKAKVDKQAGSDYLITEIKWLAVD